MEVRTVTDFRQVTPQSAPAYELEMPLARHRAERIARRLCGDCRLKPRAMSHPVTVSSFDATAATKQWHSRDEHVNHRTYKSEVEGPGDTGKRNMSSLRGSVRGILLGDSVLLVG